ncbi:TetR/AcrR family transcriptional regulator [Hyphomonadaceae bacterium ML37]|nr:TetR/AcrR family transcriptional regulator [Hyphomonadaceae bacterium ML37]
MSALETRTRIMDAALAALPAEGFEGLSIGRLAARTGLSKSGLFAHFGGQGALQIAVIDAAAARFDAMVTRPVLAEADTLERLKLLAQLWLAWVTTDGQGRPCPLMQAAMSAPGLADEAGGHARAVRARFHPFVTRLARRAVQAGQLRKDTDPQRFAFRFEALGLAAGLHALSDDPARVHACAEAEYAALFEEFAA